MTSLDGPTSLNTIQEISWAEKKEKSIWSTDNKVNQPRIYVMDETLTHAKNLRNTT